MNRLSSLVGLLAGAGFFFASCYEPKKECLDINAVNFDPTADENCCCEYPRLFVQVEQRYDTLSWLENQVCQQPSGHWFRLKKAVFYLSDFEVFRGNERFVATDSLRFSVFGSAPADTLQRYLRNDFALVRRSPLEYPAGAFPESGVFDRVQMRLGLPPEAQVVVPSKAPAGHPLATQPERLWLDRDRGYVALRLILTRDTFPATIPDTLTFARPEFDNFMLEGAGTFVHVTGSDFDVPLLVDYRELFREVDLINGTPAGWKTQIVANLPNAFRIHD